MFVPFEVKPSLVRNKSMIIKETGDLSVAVKLILTG